MIKQLINEDSYVQIEDLCSARIQLKIEGLNPAGSIKLKTAHAIITDLEGRGLINRNTRLIESSSGNLGVALAMVCAAKGYKFVCVIDPNISAPNRKLMHALGAEMLMVDQRDENGGYLNSRIRLIEQLVADNADYIWLNQYKNPINPLAHYQATAKSIAHKFPHVDYLFVGAGTTGTLMGCKNYFAEHRPHTKVIAVDTVYGAGAENLGGVDGIIRLLPTAALEEAGPLGGVLFYLVRLVIGNRGRSATNCFHVVVVGYTWFHPNLGDFVPHIMQGGIRHVKDGKQQDDDENRISTVGRK